MFENELHDVKFDLNDDSFDRNANELIWIGKEVKEQRKNIDISLGNDIIWNIFFCSSFLWIYFFSMSMYTGIMKLYVSKSNQSGWKTNV